MPFAYEYFCNFRINLEHNSRSHTHIAWSIGYDGIVVMFPNWSELIFQVSINANECRPF